MLKTEVHFSGNPCNGMTEEVHFLGESPSGTVVCYAVVKCTIADCLSSNETAVVEVILSEFGALRVAKVV